MQLRGLVCVTCNNNVANVLQREIFEFKKQGKIEDRSYRL